MEFLNFEDYNPVFPMSGCEPWWTPTQLPTTASMNNNYSSLQYGANDYSDDKTVIMANKIGENLKDEESTVETAFLVWGSDE